MIGVPVAIPVARITVPIVAAAVIRSVIRPAPILTTEVNGGRRDHHRRFANRRSIAGRWRVDRRWGAYDDARQGRKRQTESEVETNTGLGNRGSSQKDGG